MSSNDFTCPAALERENQSQTIKRVARRPSQREQDRDRMLTSAIVSKFFWKYKRNKNHDQSLWALATRKENLCADLNAKIEARECLFSLKTTAVTKDAKKVSFYYDWRDRLAEFAPFRYLEQHVTKRSLVSNSYLSWENGGRIKAIQHLRLASGNNKYFFKTDIKSYYQWIRIQKIWNKIESLHLPAFVLSLLSQTLMPAMEWWRLSK